MISSGSNVLDAALLANTIHRRPASGQSSNSVIYVRNNKNINNNADSQSDINTDAQRTWPRTNWASIANSGLSGKQNHLNSQWTQPQWTESQWVHPLWTQPQQNDNQNIRNLQKTSGQNREQESEERREQEQEMQERQQREQEKSWQKEAERREAEEEFKALNEQH